MHPDVDALRPKLKEILYDCAVEIRATKAALYLLDNTSKKYELATEYGFRNTVRPYANANDPMVDRCARGRSPFYVNSAASDPKVADLLFSASTERLMGVPLFSRGDLIGFIDMRDKAQKQPFDQLDVGKAQSIADRILALFATKNIWNHRFITVSDVTGVAIPPLPHQNAPAAPSLEQREPAGVGAVDTAKIVAAARVTTAHLATPPSPDLVGPAEIEAVKETLRSILLLRGAVVVAFSATGTPGGAQEVASRGTMTQDALSALHLKLQNYLSKRNESVGLMKTTLHNPLGVTMPPITPVQLQKVFTAPVSAANFQGLYLTAAFTEPPDQETQQLLAALLNQLQSAIESSIARSTLAQMRVRIAEGLVEPEYTSYPDLKLHSAIVVGLAESFGKALALTPAEAETLKLTAIVHDCGMRVLDYEKLYRKPSLSHDELALLREHVIVGAAMVEPLLGSDVARGVLSHHERVDGAGYPNELVRDEIPLVSRILQICDVYTVITDPSSYQTPEPPEAALAAIRRGAGAQFDKELALKFDDMMRDRVQSTTLAGR